jgi:hypothetical protein
MRDLDHLQRRLEREQQVRKQAEAENRRVALAARYIQRTPGHSEIASHD